MLGTIQRSFSSKKKSRPYSALSSMSHQTEYRLTDNESLNSIRSSIHQTFDSSNRDLKEIKGLTERLGSKYQKRIDRLCQQFSIGPSSRRRSFSGNVDVEFIAKKYINSKSKEKKKQQEKEVLKKQVTKVVNRYTPKHPRPFFKFDLQTLREMEYKSRKNLNCTNQHPYIEIYEQSQAEALVCLTERNELQLDKIGVYADIVQPEDWERYQKQVKQIYSGVRSLRKDRRQNSPYFKQGPSKENFFIT